MDLRCGGGRERIDPAGVINIWAVGREDVVVECVVESGT
jgi:hypothetical protein